MNLADWYSDILDRYRVLLAQDPVFPYYKVTIELASNLHGIIARPTYILVPAILGFRAPQTNPSHLSFSVGGIRK